MSCANGAKCPSVPGHVVADYHRLNIYRPTRIYTPRTKHELVAGIIEIESSGLKAKAMGSNMSFSAVTRTDDCLIETDMLSKHLSIPHAAGNVPWTPDRFRDGVVVDRLVTMMAPPVLNKHPMLIYVEGGIKIKDLLKDWRRLLLRVWRSQRWGLGARRVSPDLSLRGRMVPRWTGNR